MVFSGRKQLPKLNLGSTANAAPRAVRDRVSEGDIIRVSGDVEMLDFGTSFEFANGIFDGFDNFNEEIQEIRRFVGDEVDLEDFDEFQGPEMDLYDAFFDLLEEMMPKEYNDMVASNIYPLDDEDQNLEFWALIQGDSLESDPVELLSKYQSSNIPNCTVLARVETITNEDAGPDPEGEDEEDMDLGSLHHFVDSLAAEFGFKVSYPSIAISPITIYR